jgi:hypothetical protein
MVEFKCKLKGCTLNNKGICIYKVGVSWINVLNCPNPEVWNNQKEK